MSKLFEVLTESRDLGFLGPGPVEDHIAHARAFATAIGAGSQARILDLGSGGGVPGFVVAVELPDAEVLLLDAQLRRTEFLNSAMVSLGLRGRVRVVRARAEELGRDAAWRGRFDVVTARGFGPPAVTAECAAPFLRIGGRLLVSEPPDSAGERWSLEGLAKLGMDAPEIRTEVSRLAVLRQTSSCPDAFPRARPHKRPLF